MMSLVGGVGVMEVDIDVAGKTRIVTLWRQQSSWCGSRRKEKTCEANERKGRAVDAFEPAFGETGARLSSESAMTLCGVWWILRL